MTSIDDDTRLMQAFQAGDEESFNRLLVKYERPLIGFICRFTQNLAQAEDLAQETFLRVYRAKDRYTPAAKFSTWLYRIAANLCLDFGKKLKRDALRRAEPLTVTDGEEERERPLPDAAPSLHAALEERERSGKVRECLLSLPENQRLAIVLKMYEDKSYQEIAEILNTSVPSIESLLFRARQTLKIKLCKVGE